MQNLVINAGSSSVKFSVFRDEKVVLSGICEEIGSERSVFQYTYQAQKQEQKESIPAHKIAFEKIIAALKENKILDDIDFVVHRIVHGGEKFAEATEITSETIEKLKTLDTLAPLHNPSNILGVTSMMKFLPEVQHFAVFDTAFHATMPEEAYLYALPYEWYEKHAIRRYGFHGSSHKYVVGEAMKLLHTKEHRIISCHLGNGSSLCASQDGKSINTTMGMTPLEGMMMGTRSGSFDPAIVFQMMQKERLTKDEIDVILNKKSGLLGVSGISSDMRVIEAEMKNGNPGALRAFNLFVHKIVRYIGFYACELKGVDAIVFTGGIGENDALTRKRVLEHVEFLGVEVDYVKNDVNTVGEISTPDSKIKVFIIPTNEELQMTRDCMNLVR